MAGDWIKIESVTPDKPEVYAMAEKLGIDPDAVFGKLFRVWAWADQHTEDGSVFNITTALVDRLAGIAGFGDAMESVAWLVRCDGGLEFPNFDRHNGQTAKRRANTAKRVSKSRAKCNAECNASVTPKKQKKVTLSRTLVAQVMKRDNETCQYCGRKKGQIAPNEVKGDGILSIDHVIPESRNGSHETENLVVSCMPCNRAKGDRTPEEAGLKWPEDVTGKRYGRVTKSVPREEKRREDNIGDASASPGAGGKNRFDPLGVSLPPELDNDRFRQSWASWVEYRKNTRRKPLSLAACSQQIPKLAQFGADVAIKAIEASIANDWTGLFPERVEVRKSSSGLDNEARRRFLERHAND